MRTKEQEAERKRRRRIRFVEFLKEFKKNKKCERCGYCENTRILCFHHKDKNTKRIEISEIRTSQTAFLKEIKKCEILCPNCHYIEHLKGF